MTNILINDVQTYVRELISKEFGSVKKEEKAQSGNRKLINTEHQKQQKQTAVFGQKIIRINRLNLFGYGSVQRDHQFILN